MPNPARPGQCPSAAPPAVAESAVTGSSFIARHGRRVSSRVFFRPIKQGRRAMESPDPQGLSMTVKDVFFVNTPGRGTVLTGHLDGCGVLRVGDGLACGDQVFEILGIEKFRHVLRQIEGGHDVGLALGTRVPATGFAGRAVTFLPRPGPGVPALTPQDWAVPSHTAVMVGWSSQRGVVRPRFGALVFDGLTVALHDEDDSELFSVHGSRLVVRAVGTTLSVVNREEDVAVGCLPGSASSAVGFPPGSASSAVGFPPGSASSAVGFPPGSASSAVGFLPGSASMARYIVGPDPRWAGSPRAATLLAKHGVEVYPDLRLAAVPRWWQRIMIMPASRALNRKIIWRDVLLAMLRTRGAVTSGR